MARLDPFSQQIVEMVRNMPDDAILELVRNQLGAVMDSAPAATYAPAAPARGRPGRPKKAKKKAAASAAAAPRTTKKAGRRGPRRSSADREKMLELVEKTVKSSKGLSASEIAKKTKIPQSRVASAVRELKAAKRIFQGGDRRFARYAGDTKTALKASTEARKNAPGPQRR